MLSGVLNRCSIPLLHHLYTDTLCHSISVKVRQTVTIRPRTPARNAMSRRWSVPLDREGGSARSCRDAGPPGRRFAGTPGRGRCGRRSREPRRFGAAHGQRSWDPGGFRFGRFGGPEIPVVWSRTGPEAPQSRWFCFGRCEGPAIPVVLPGILHKPTFPYAIYLRL